MANFVTNPEWVAQQLLNFLESNLDTSLSTLATAYGDGIVLGPTDQFFGFPQANYPPGMSVVVYALSMAPINSGDPRHTHVVSVLIVGSGKQDDAADAPSHILNKRVWRFAEAIHGLLNNLTAGNVVDRVFTEGAELVSDPEEGGALQQRVAMTFNIWTTNA